MPEFEGSVDNSKYQIRLQLSADELRDKQKFQDAIRAANLADSNIRQLGYQSPKDQTDYRVAAISQLTAILPNDNAVKFIDDLISNGEASISFEKAENGYKVTPK